MYIFWNDIPFHFNTLPAIVGDITPHDGVSKEEKHKLEADAMTEICQKLGSGDAGRTRLLLN